MPEQKLVIIVDQSPIALGVKHPGAERLFVETQMKDGVLQFPRERQGPKAVVELFQRAGITGRRCSWPAHYYVSERPLTVEFHPNIAIIEPVLFHPAFQ